MIMVAMGWTNERESHLLISPGSALLNELIHWEDLDHFIVSSTVITPEQDALACKPNSLINIG